MPELAISAAPVCEAKLRAFDTAGTMPPYCRRSVALGSFIDRQGIRRYHCQAEGHRQRVEQLYGIASIEVGVAVFAAPSCRFCHRTDVIEQGIYTRVKFPDGIGLVCSLCEEKADQPDDDAHFNWNGHDVAVEAV